MKIAVASEGNQVTGHFGHCEQFHIYSAVNNKIVEEVSLKNPGHKPGYLPNFLNEQGVNVIISGGMGGGAVDIFNDKNIEVVIGNLGNSREMAEKYLRGELKSTGSVCHDHAHQDECGE